MYRMLLHESKSAAIQHIHNLIVAGGDPKHDPDLSVVYYALVDEFGQNLFAAEKDSQLDGFVLTKEEACYRYN